MEERDDVQRVRSVISMSCHVTETCPSGNFTLDPSGGVRPSVPVEAGVAMQCPPRHSTQGSVDKS